MADWSDASTYISNILQANLDKNFVARLMWPDIYPATMKRPDLGKGTYSTHLMSSGEVGGKGMAFPEITQDPSTGKLVRRSGREAMEYAQKSGEYIPFETPQEAEWFAKNYKRGVPKRGKSMFPLEF